MVASIEPMWASEDGQVQLYLGDCLDVLPTLEAGSVDAVVTDPPYGSGAYETDVVVPWHDLLPMLDVGMLAIFGYPESLVNFCAQFQMAPVEWVTWYPPNKPNGRGGVLCKTQECIAIFGHINRDAVILKERSASGKKIAAAATALGHYRHPTHSKADDVWTDAAPGVMFQWRLRQHPNEKPVTLMHKLVTLCSQPGATVLDPFMGSGTTGVACVQTGRRFIGIEIEEKYFNIAVKRIQEAKMQLRMEL